MLTVENNDNMVSKGFGPIVELLTIPGLIFLLTMLTVENNYNMVNKGFGPPLEMLRISRPLFLQTKFG
jgi:hypothetical protein